MVNLILDTNAWIYLANGFNPDSNEIEENFHFELAEKLVEKINKDQCRIFSNWIIKDEWNRNKSKCNTLIERYEHQIEQKKNELKKKRKHPNYAEYAAINREEVNVLYEVV